MDIIFCAHKFYVAGRRQELFFARDSKRFSFESLGNQITTVLCLWLWHSIFTATGSDAI